MKYAQNLGELERAISGCLHCNGCYTGPWPENNEICPIYTYDRCFANTAGGLMYLAKALIKGQTEYTQKLAEMVYTCTSCRGCDELCMIMRSVNPDMPLSDIIRLMRHELVKRGFIPEKIKSLYDTVKENGDIPGDENAVPAIPAEIKKDDADLVLYADCFHTPTQAAIYAGTVNVLKKMGRSVSLYATGGCCGSTLFDYGFWDELPALVDRNAAKMKDYAGKTFLFVNPHCQEFITNRYALAGTAAEPVQGRHISEIMAEALAQGKLKAKDGKVIKVSYHDPCMLSRGLEIGPEKR